MGWRTEAREAVTRCRRHAGLARADAARARKHAAGTADPLLRDYWLDSAQSCDQSADLFDRISEDYQVILRGHARGYDR
jgi:hypothetical protein